MKCLLFFFSFCPSTYSSNIVTTVLSSVVTWSTKSPPESDRQRERRNKTERERESWTRRKVGHFQGSSITSHHISPHHWPAQTAIIYPYSPQASTHTHTHTERQTYIRIKDHWGWLGLCVFVLSATPVLHMTDPAAGVNLSYNPTLKLHSAQVSQVQMNHTLCSPGSHEVFLAQHL